LRESDDDERFAELANDDGRVLGYDGTSGILDVPSELPKYCVVGLVVSGSGGSGARNGTEKCRDGALMHREKNGVKYPRTTTAIVQESASRFPTLKSRTNPSASC
jgi:hypothetical protein